MRDGHSRDGPGSSDGDRTRYGVEPQESQWKDRFIPPKGAQSSAYLTAGDGHYLVADLYPEAPGQPPKLVVTCDPLEFDDGADTVRRFPTFEEIGAAADYLAPGSLFHVPFVSMPEAVEREPLPDEMPRAVVSLLVGVVQVPGAIEVVGG